MIELLQLIAPHVPAITLGLAAFALCFFMLGVHATLRHTRRARPTLADDALPPVSILKPLKGLEESLEENLESYFAQDYPSFEIVFASTEVDDPALVVARRVAARHPAIPVRFARSDAGFGLNPKVANLAGALRGAEHDLVLQSDANVRARPDYLRRVVSELLAEDASLLSSMVSGTGERSAGATMENLQLTAMIAPSTCFALAYFGVPCVIGKSMLFRRSELAEIGGLEHVRDVLAEDYLLGRAYQRLGKRVLLSTTQAENINRDITVDRFMSRHARWLKMRAVVHPPAFVADLFANPVGLGLLAVVFSGLDLRYVAAFGALALGKVSADAYLVRRTRSTPMSWRALVWAPLKDVLLMAIWPYAAVSRSIEWRGTRLRIGWGTKLRADEGALAVRALRRVLGVAGR